MKFNTLTTALLLFASWLLLTNGKIDPNNPPTARTGAPGETTCSASGCHNGGAYTGTVKITGIPDTVVAGQSYPVTLTNTSNAVRAGFELTCLDGSMLKCGTLTTGSGTSVASVTSTGRQYIRQSTPKNLSAGSASWSFTWKAPATASNNTATFYFVTLCANSNGNNSGDNVLSATKKIVFKTAVPTQEPDLEVALKMYPTSVQDVLNIELLDAQSGRLDVFDMQGRGVLQKELSNVNALDVSMLKTGAYIAQINANGKRATRKFVVE